MFKMVQRSKLYQSFRFARHFGVRNAYVQYMNEWDNFLLAIFCASLVFIVLYFGMVGFLWADDWKAHVYENTISSCIARERDSGLRPPHWTTAELRRYCGNEFRRPD